MIIAQIIVESVKIRSGDPLELPLLFGIAQKFLIAPTAAGSGDTSKIVSHHLLDIY